MTTGVLLAQLGTPDAPTTEAVRRYLKEFLLDRRVVDISPWLWKPVLYGFILRTRPATSAANYARIWTDRGSPLLLETESLASKLGTRLGERFRVTFGMRVGNPSIASRLDELVAAGCDEIQVLPCFPQWSTATSLSVEDAVAWWRDDHPDAPQVTVLGSYPAHPSYIAALAASVRDSGFVASPETPLVISFHGLPQAYADRGDPYPNECDATAAALVAELGLADEDWVRAYQSRFGRAAWLQPYCSETLKALAGRGIRAVGVIAPSFLADCLETIDEIGRELREEFEEAGGTSFTRIDCLNDRDDLADALAHMVKAAQDASPHLGNVGM